MVELLGRRRRRRPPTPRDPATHRNTNMEENIDRTVHIQLKIISEYVDCTVHIYVNIPENIDRTIYIWLNQDFQKLYKIKKVHTPRHARNVVGRVQKVCLPKKSPG